MASRFFDCYVTGCIRPSARSVGAGCDICSSHFCSVHMSRKHHKCGSLGELDEAAYKALVDDELGRLRALVNEKAICVLASRLNNDRSCTIEYTSLMGCANYHIRIRFGHGHRSWLMRIPRITGFAVGLPVSLAEYLIRSEYATLKFLETTTVPTSRALSFGIPSQDTDQGIGVPFLLMEELPGRPWNGRGDAVKVWKGLAEIYTELARHPFTQIGSLYVESPDDIPVVSALASDRFACLYPYGPFGTQKAYYTAWSEQYLVLIADGQMYPQFPVEAYLIYRFLKENVTQLSDPEDCFYLKHVDDKGDHIMVDEDMNITGVIDWQMARVVPRREAFALSLVSADMHALCDGVVSRSANDIAFSNALQEKSPELARFAQDEKVRRFFWGLGLESEWINALPLANAILTVFGVEQSWDEWSKLAIKRYDGDERLRTLLSECSKS